MTPEQICERLTPAQRHALEAYAWGNHMHFVPRSPRPARNGRGRAVGPEERRMRALERFALIEVSPPDALYESSGWRGWWTHATPLGLDVMHRLHPRYRVMVERAWATS